MSGMKTASAADRPRKEPKVLDDLRVKGAENGGATVEHHFTSYEHKPETHVFGKDEGDALAQHVLKAVGMDCGK